MGDTVERQAGKDSELGVWDCPACEDTFVGVSAKETFRHLCRCGKPPSGYRGFVKYGVLPKYASELEQIMGK